MKFCELYLPFLLLLVEILICKGLFTSKTLQLGANTHVKLSIFSSLKLLIPRDFCCCWKYFRRPQSYSGSEGIQFHLCLSCTYMKYFELFPDNLLGTALCSVQRRDAKASQDMTFIYCSHEKWYVGCREEMNRFSVINWHIQQTITFGITTDNWCL